MFVCSHFIIDRWERRRTQQNPRKILRRLFVPLISAKLSLECKFFLFFFSSPFFFASTPHFSPPLLLTPFFNYFPRPEKKRAPRATREIKKFAKHQLGTSDVRIHIDLNKHIWSRGIRHVPKRVRVRFSRKVNTDDDAKEKMYTLCTPEVVESFKGLLSVQAVEGEN